MPYLPLHDMLYPKVLIDRTHKTVKTDTIRLVLQHYDYTSTTACMHAVRYLSEHTNMMQHYDN